MTPTRRELQRCMKLAHEKGRRAGYAQGVADGESLVMKGLAAVGHLNGSARGLLVAAVPEPTPPPITDELLDPDWTPPPVVKAKPPDHAARAAALLAWVAECEASGTDPTAGLDAILGGETVEKSWREDLHPRDKSGRFIGRDRLQAAHANPGGKEAKQLRREVDPADKAKLEHVLAHGLDAVGRTQRGESKHRAAAKKQARALTKSAAMGLVEKLADGKGQAEDVEALADHLKASWAEGGLSRDHINLLQTVIGGGGRKRVEMVESLLERARQATGEPEADAGQPGEWQYGVDRPPTRGAKRSQWFLFRRRPDGTTEVAEGASGNRRYLQSAEAAKAAAAEMNSGTSAPTDADRTEAQEQAHRQRSNRARQDAAGIDPRPAVPTDDRDAERYDASRDKLDRMQSWAGAKPHDMAAQTAVERAAARVEGAKSPTGEGKPAVSGGKPAPPSDRAANLPDEATNGKSSHELTAEQYARRWHALGQEEAHRAGGKVRTWEEDAKAMDAAGGKPGEFTATMRRLHGSPHKAAVEEALAAGKPVPAHVLADYPGLAPQSPSGGALTPGGIASAQSRAAAESDVNLGLAAEIDKRKPTATVPAKPAPTPAPVALPADANAPGLLPARAPGGFHFHTVAGTAHLSEAEYEGFRRTRDEAGLRKLVAERLAEPAKPTPPRSAAQAAEHGPELPSTERVVPPAGLTPEQFRAQVRESRGRIRQEELDRRRAHYAKLNAERATNPPRDAAASPQSATPPGGGTPRKPPSNTLPVAAPGSPDPGGHEIRSALRDFHTAQDAFLSSPGGSPAEKQAEAGRASHIARLAAAVVATPEDQIEDKPKLVAALKDRQSYERDATRAVAIKAALAHLGEGRKMTADQVRSVAAMARANGHDVDADADRGEVWIRRRDPRSGNVVMKQVSGTTQEAVDAAATAAGYDMRRRQQETAARVAAERAVERE